MIERFQKIHLGNMFEYVIKDHKTNKTYGRFSGDKKSMMEFLKDLETEINDLEKCKKDLSRIIAYLIKYKGLNLCEIKEDICNNDYYDNFWLDGGTFTEFWEDDDCE